MAEKTVTIKRSEASMRSQVIRADLSKFNACYGMGRYEEASRTIDSMAAELRMLALLLKDNPSLG